jgi:hypothetical protein
MRAMRCLLAMMWYYLDVVMVVVSAWCAWCCCVRQGNARKGLRCPVRHPAARRMHCLHINPSDINAEHSKTVACTLALRNDSEPSHCSVLLCCVYPAGASAPRCCWLVTPTSCLRWGQAGRLLLRWQLGCFPASTCARSTAVQQAARSSKLHTPSTRVSAMHRCMPAV